MSYHTQAMIELLSKTAQDVAGPDMTPKTPYGPLPNFTDGAGGLRNAPPLGLPARAAAGAPAPQATSPEQSSVPGPAPQRGADPRLRMLQQFGSMALPGLVPPVQRPAGTSAPAPASVATAPPAAPAATVPGTTPTTPFGPLPDFTDGAGGLLDAPPIGLPERAAAETQPKPRNWETILKYLQDPRVLATLGGVTAGGILPMLFGQRGRGGGQNLASILAMMGMGGLAGYGGHRLYQHWQQGRGPATPAAATPDAATAAPADGPAVSSADAIVPSAEELELMSGNYEEPYYAGMGEKQQQDSIVDPRMRNALLGATIGGTGASLWHMLRRREGQPNRTLERGLLGAALGGALGGAMPTAPRAPAPVAEETPSRREPLIEPGVPRAGDTGAPIRTWGTPPEDTVVAARTPASPASGSTNPVLQAFAERLNPPTSPAPEGTPSAQPASSDSEGTPPAPTRQPTSVILRSAEREPLPASIRRQGLPDRIGDVDLFTADAGLETYDRFNPNHVRDRFNRPDSELNTSVVLPEGTHARTLVDEFYTRGIPVGNQGGQFLDTSIAPDQKMEVLRAAGIIPPGHDNARTAAPIYDQLVNQLRGIDAPDPHAALQAARLAVAHDEVFERIPKDEARVSGRLISEALRRATISDTGGLDHPGSSGRPSIPRWLAPSASVEAFGMTGTPNYSYNPATGQLDMVIEPTGGLGRRVGQGVMDHVGPLTALGAWRGATAKGRPLKNRAGLAVAGGAAGRLAEEGVARIVLRAMANQRGAVRQ